MIVCIPNLLTAEELKYLNGYLDIAEFVEGKSTAGQHLKQIKKNQQLAQDNSSSGDLKAVVYKALMRNQLFQAAVWPKIIHSIIFSRYQVGMFYGAHIDNPLMGGSNFLRSDVSFTVFLNASDAYAGGELVIEGGNGESPYKLAAGSVILYPSTTLHKVAPVISGERRVAVGWVQSLIRDTENREVLFDLATVKQALLAQAGKTTEVDLLSKSLANLMRKWAE